MFCVAISHLTRHASSLTGHFLASSVLNLVMDFVFSRHRFRCLVCLTSLITDVSHLSDLSLFIFYSTTLTGAVAGPVFMSPPLHGLGQYQAKETT